MPRPPVGVAPVEVGPVEITPVEVGPVEITPVRMAPVEVTPVEVAAIEVAPVEVAPVEIARTERPAVAEPPMLQPRAPAQSGPQDVAAATMAIGSQGPVKPTAAPSPPSGTPTPPNGVPAPDPVSREPRGVTAAQLRRFIKSRPYVPMHELRRRFELNGAADDVTPIDLPSGIVFVGLPERESRFIADLVTQGDVGLEICRDPSVPIVVGIYAMRPISRQ